MAQSFFLPGEARDPAYQNVRDLEHNGELRAFVEDLWIRFQPPHDGRHFRSDAKANFQQRFWEMYLFAALQDMGLDPQKGKAAGPDFHVVIAGRRYWIEAVAPRKGDGPDQVPEIVYGECRRSPLAEIQLRYAGVIREKASRWASWVTKGLVAAEDGFVVAVNGRGCNDFHDGYPPLFVRACLPIGFPVMSIDRETGKVVDSYYAYADSVPKKNGEFVSTAAFLEDGFRHISGVLHSLAYCAHRPENLLEGMEFLHNPLAVAPIPDPPLQGLRRFAFSDSQLTQYHPNPPWPEAPVLEMDD
jgi:hypothetical protein